MARRRRAALLAVAAVATGTGVVIGAGSDDTGQVAAPALPPTCPETIAGDDRRLVGQMLVVRMESVATEALLRAARRGEIGGVVVFPQPSTAPDELRAELAELRGAARNGGAPPPVVAIDQEGGEVKRLAELPPERSPSEIAAQGVEAASEEGLATGRALARVGVVADLAPVLDVAGGPDAFIASRTFGEDPAQVAALGVAFGEGLQSAGVAASAKHFPGLGTATVNTDLEPSVVEADRRSLARGLEPFRAAVEAGFGLVMVSSATYPALGGERPASQSPRVVDGLLRERLGFEGVVISDDLGAGALAGSGIDEGEAAVGAAAAGVDLLLFALSDGAAARTALLRALRRGELDRERLLASCARVTALRERFAIGSDGP